MPINTNTSVSFQEESSAPSPILMVDTSYHALPVTLDSKYEEPALQSVYTYQNSDYSKLLAPPNSLGVSRRLIDEDLSDWDYDDEDTTTTSFSTSKPVYFKLLSPPETYTLHTTAGTIRTSATGVPHLIAETITFDLKDTAELSHVPSGAVVWRWIGKAPGPLLFNGKTVKIQNSLMPIGILECRYITLAHRLQLNVQNRDLTVTTSTGEEEETPLPVSVSVIVDREIVASISVTIQAYLMWHSVWGCVWRPANLGLGEAEPDNPFVLCRIKVTDYCTGLAVENATVWVDGVSVGTADEFGVVDLGELEEGSTHTLKITASGYVASDADVLYNDEFTVPTLPEETE